MTDKQINAAITEAIDADPHWKCAKNYCKDLNAMHEAEMELSPHQRDQMRMRLNVTLGEEYWRATARQRAEAFLRTLGKWEEVQE